MAQAMAEDGGRVPMSPGLQATLLRAREYAAGQSEAQVLLEHLLLALSEDTDAASVLDACQIDLGRLRNDVAGYLGSLDDRVPPGTPGAPAISQALTQVLRYATLAAQQGRRTSIDGAIVLAALVGDGRSMAASFLKAQGLTFEAAIQALRQAATRGATGPNVQIPGQAPFHLDGPGMATTTQAEDILARARARVETRSAYRPEAPSEAQPASSPGPAPPSVTPAQGLPSSLSEPAPQARPDEPPLAAKTAEDRLSSPPDPVAEATDMQHQPPGEPGSGSTPTAGTGPDAMPRAEGIAAANNAPFAPPADAAGPRDEPEPERADAAAASPVPSTSLPDPGTQKAGGTDLDSALKADQPTAPPRVPQAEPSSFQSGWTPPPVRPATPRQPAVRPLPPPPPSWTTPPSPPTPPPPSQVRVPSRPADADLTPPPAHWSRSRAPLDARHEPATASYSPPALAPPAGPAEHGGAAGRRPAVDPAQVTYTIPRRLRQGRPQVIEIWIERPPIAGVNASRSFALRAENVVARAIAVRLRPLSGKFIIDAASPETQWDQSGAAGPNRLASEAAVWRYTVTPLQSGRGILQLAVSARTLGADGVLAETQLPDQTHELRVAPHYSGVLRRIAYIACAAIAGMVAIKLVETQMEMDVYYFFKQLLRSRP